MAVPPGRFRVSACSGSDPAQRRRRRQQHDQLASADDGPFAVAASDHPDATAAALGRRDAPASVTCCPVGPKSWTSFQRRPDRDGSTVAGQPGKNHFCLFNDALIISKCSNYKISKGREVAVVPANHPSRVRFLSTL